MQFNFNKSLSIWLSYVLSTNYTVNFTMLIFAKYIPYFIVFVFFLIIISYKKQIFLYSIITIGLGFVFDFFYDVSIEHHTHKMLNGQIDILPYAYDTFILFKITLIYLISIILFKTDMKVLAYVFLLFSILNTLAIFYCNCLEATDIVYSILVSFFVILFTSYFKRFFNEEIITN